VFTLKNCIIVNMHIKWRPLFNIGTERKNNKKKFNLKWIMLQQGMFFEEQDRGITAENFYAAYEERINYCDENAITPVPSC
jgi:hypothetical protein